MLQVSERLIETAPPSATLTLPFEQRCKSRFRARLDNGEEVGLLLPRGTVLRHGDLLRATNGMIIQVRAAPEAVTTAVAEDVLSLARACYHLGNRHVPLQIGSNWLRYPNDHVLDQMVSELGLTLFRQHTSFEPENGAYHGHH